jgi:arginine decarboxylase
MNKIITPSTVLLTSGTGHGHTPLNAFDNALLDAGVGNFNLIKVSSIVPPGAVVEKSKTKFSKIPNGSLIYAVYTHSISGLEGEKTASVLAAAVPKNQKTGVIFESSSDKKDVRQLEKIVTKMVEEACNKRGVEIEKIIYTNSQVEVKRNYACSVSLAVLI